MEKIESTNPNPHLLSVKEAAKFLNVAPISLYVWISQGRIPVIKLSRRCVRFRMSDLQAYLDAKLVSARQPAPAH